MTKNEKLVLACAAFHDQIKAASVALEDNFRAPIKTWLKTLKDRERIVDGTIKAFIRPTSEVSKADFIAPGHTEVALVDAAKSGSFSARVYQDLIASGLLVPVGGPELAVFLVDKGIGSLAGYTIHVPSVPAGWTDELRLTALAKGRFEGLKTSLKKTVDLEATIIRTANEIEAVPLSTEVPIKVGLVAIKAKSKA